MKAAFPLNQPLAIETLQARFAALGGALCAVRVWRNPDPTKKARLLVKDNISVEG